MDNVLLIAAIAIGALAVFWVVRKVFKLALLAAVVGAGFLIWYFFAN
ncbi:MAG: hypothetical protein ACE5MI_08500 [Acidimicrobiia bacterium]